MKIIDNEDRDKLNEGRSNGMGFAFLKKINKDHYVTVQPVSPCKDFLNEVLYVEKTGIKTPKIYGLEYGEKQNIFPYRYGFIGIRICKYKYDNDYNEQPFEEARDAFNANYKNVQSFMNQLEELLELKTKTKIEPSEDDHFLVKVPKFWLSKVYLLSLYTLLLRAYQKYDDSLPALEYYEQESPHYSDNGLIMGMNGKLQKIIAGDMPSQEFKKAFDVSSVGQTITTLHNGGGIISVKFNK